MGRIKWYKRDPSAALNGMMELTLDERGAYNTVLDLIYSRDGNLPDDDRFIAGWLRVDVRVWKRIKAALLSRKKLFISEGMLRNERADVEVLMALSRVESARDAGLASARSKSFKLEPKPQENNDLDLATVEADVPTTVSTNHNYNHKEEPNGSSPPVSPKRSKRATSLPEDWTPSFGPKTQALVDQWPPGMLERELQKFRDHAADKGRLSNDWNAAFRTWAGNADEWSKKNGNRGQTNQRNSPSRDGDDRSHFARAVDNFGGLPYDRPYEPAGAADGHATGPGGAGGEPPSAQVIPLLR